GSTASWRRYCIRNNGYRGLLYGYGILVPTTRMVQGYDGKGAGSNPRKSMCSACRGAGTGYFSTKLILNDIGKVRRSPAYIGYADLSRNYIGITGSIHRIYSGIRG